MHLDRQRILSAFEKYTSNYDTTDTKVQLKIDHTYRVAKLCEVIARSLKLSEEETDFAWLSGMLHDIGRFEQLRRFGTFQDKVSVNHAALSADLLFHEDLILKFVEKGDMDFRLMDKVIRYHNVYALPENQEAKERMFCDILRDADKIDILKVNIETPRTEIYDLPEEAFRTSAITAAVLEDILSGRNVDRRNSTTGIDFILGHISFVYGLVFPESVRQVKQQGYLQQLLDFQSDNPDTAAKMRRINETIHRYMDMRLSA